MPRPAQKPDIDPNLFATLRTASRRYKLREPHKNITNDELAERLDLAHQLGDHVGVPNCCFFDHGCLVAIRTKQNEVSIFHMWQSTKSLMEGIADRVE